MRFRDLVDMYTKRIGFLFILLATPMWFPRDQLEVKEYKDLLGSALFIDHIRQLRIDECRELIEKLLSSYRDPKAPPSISKIHPFSEEAVDEICVRAEGRPRRIYEIASRVLVSGVDPPIGVDDVLLYGGIYKREWYDAMDSPPVDLPKLVIKALQVASMLSRNSKLGIDGRLLVIPVEMIEGSMAKQLVEVRGGENIEPQRMLNDLKKAVDVLVYLEKQDEIRAYLVKVTNRRIDKRHLNKVLDFVQKYSLKLRGKIIPPDNIHVLLISRRISKTVLESLDLVEATLFVPIKIELRELAKDEEDTPECYGVLRWIYDEAERYKDDVDNLSRLADDVEHVLRNVLRLIP